MRDVRLLFGLVTLLALGACAGAAPEGDPSAPPAEHTEIPGLPRLTIALSHTTVRFRTIVDEAVASSEEPLPLPPRGPSIREFHRWVEDRMGPWLAVRGERLANATAALDRLRTGDADERTIGAAIVGHMYEDTTTQVLTADRPRDLDAAADDRLTAALRERLAPLEARAEEAYRICMNVASGAPAHVDPWRRFCEVRLRAQPVRTAAEPTPDPASEPVPPSDSPDAGPPRQPE
jgi:hypothetical protein